MLVLMVPPNLKAALSPGTRRSSTPGVIRRQLNGFIVSLHRTLHVHAVLLDGVLRADIGAVDGATEAAGCAPQRTANKISGPIACTGLVS